jgi:hypothetical protein
VVASRCARTARALVALLAVLTVSEAHAAITFTPGSNLVSTPEFELDFGDANVEWLGVRWRGPGGLGPELAGSGGAGPACATSDALETWGQAYGDSNVNPILVAAGTRGTWTARGGRTVEITSTVPKACFNTDYEVPVRTRYTFYDAFTGDKIRVERRFSFNAQTPDFPNTQGLRPYVTRMSSVHDFVVHPNAAGNALVSEPPCGEGCLAASWNGTWFAVNRSDTNSGLVVLRDPANASPAKLIRDFDSLSASNNSSQTLTKPAGGWKSALTETMYLCFYTTSEWPLASRNATSLPTGCAPGAVPVNTAVPTISGLPARQGVQLSASPGTWESQTGGFAYEWQRCTGASCAAIGSATAQTYTPSDIDVGKTLRVKATATATGGEQDFAFSAQTAAVQPPPPPKPANQVLPAISGAAAPGQTLTADPGGWTGNPTTYAYLWRSCDSAGNACTDIAGATAATYVVPDAQLGRRLRVRVTATGQGGTSSPADSAPTPVVAAGNVAPANLAPPTVSTGDPPREDDVITSSPGLWSGSPTLAYQWLRCNGFGGDCQEIPGATGTQYTLVGADVDRTLRIRVLASSAGGTTIAESGPTAAVREPPLSARLVVSPNPTCVRTYTLLDMTGSRGGAGGIANYRVEMTGDEYRGGGWPGDPAWEPTGGKTTEVIYDGPRASPGVFIEPPTNIRGWQWVEQTNRGWFGGDSWEARLPISAYGPVDLVLVVRDRLGATARSAPVHVDFVQKRSDQADTSCPRQAVALADPIYVKPTDIKVGAVKGNTVGSRVPCRGSLDCAGALSYTVTPRVSAAGAKAVRPRALATAAFDIPAGKTATVRAKLTKRGRQALRKRKRVKALMVVTRRQVDGSYSSRIRRITLRR